MYHLLCIVILIFSALVTSKFFFSFRKQLLKMNEELEEKIKEKTEEIVSVQNQKIAELQKTIALLTHKNGEWVDIQDMRPENGSCVIVFIKKDEYLPWIKRNYVEQSLEITSYTYKSGFNLSEKNRGHKIVCWKYMDMPKDEKNV